MKKILIKILLSIVILILFTMTAFNIYINNIKKESPNKELTIEDLKELSKTVKDDRINILLLGVDHLDGNENYANMRTDTMMLLSVYPKKKNAFVLSIPRDTRVEIEGYKYKYNKITTAHAFGGVSLTLKTVKKLLDIPIHHFVKVDYRALSKTVDDIGGVGVDVPMDMYYEDPYSKPPLVIDLKQGYQVLDGNKAMQFLRFRNGYANQDLGRIESQQKFIESFLQKVLSADSITKIPNYIDTFYRYVQTDMSINDMLKVASKCIDINPQNIKKEMLAGEPKTLYGTAYFIADEEEVKKQLDILIKGDYYVEQNSLKNPKAMQEIRNMLSRKQKIAKKENSQDKKEGIKENIKQEPKKQEKVKDEKPKPYVVVLNGNGKQGLAQRAIDLLFVNEIDVQDSSNADNFEYKETTVYYKDDVKLAENVSKILGAKKIVQENKAYYNKPTDILVILGSDFTK